MIVNVNTAENLSRNEWKLIETEMHNEPERMTIADHIKQKIIGAFLIAGSVVLAKLTHDLTASLILFPFGFAVMVTKQKVIL